jgi:acyl-CoA thioesterase
VAAFNNSRSPLNYRQLSYYLPSGTILTTDINLHACAHLFTSDRNNLSVVSRATGFNDQVRTSSKNLVLKDRVWAIQEACTPRSEGGRGMHRSRMWNESGTHVASTWQDGFVRQAGDQKQKRLWIEGRSGLVGCIRDESKGLVRYEL